ncbi:MAG: 5'-nucleotidase [Deltaproteobacteria bacterium ADurb.Bin135]|nr:MAG: 5'-nucleotidase [Deltaproteobacteria bacterium ADurb.Bin135]
MIHKTFILKLYNAANMQRWNDKIRPVELRELDKQAHKMMIAWFLGKFEEKRQGFNWLEVIEGGLFEFLQRIVLTDLKPQVFNRIKEDHARYNELNKWVFAQLEPVISPFGGEFCNRFRNHFSSTDDTISKKILSASHFYATRWEFDIIERANPGGYEIPKIKDFLQERQEKYYDLKGIQQLALYSRYRNFIDLCGQLRFQVRWNYVNMNPRISVLGHMLNVAILSYLLSNEIGACPKRCSNNYFTGLFHDLPEVLTRDIISPVKRSIEGLDELIKEYEKEQMEKEVYGLIPTTWHQEMKMFTEDEFSSIITIDSKTVRASSDEISDRYNSDSFDPRDGELLKAVDELSAFTEAYLALENGVKSKELNEAKASIRGRYKNRVIAGIKFDRIYADF